MSWHLPSEAEILRTLDATWPATRYVGSGPFTLRRGDGGGQRVSAATAIRPAAAADISTAASAMLAMGQKPLFMIASQDAALDVVLAAQDYAIKDPVSFFAAPVAGLARLDQKELAASQCQTPLEVMKEIWAAGGIGPGRLAVMARAKGPKTYFLGRVDEAPSGAAYVALHGKIAMLHALEVLPSARRKGLGQAMIAAAATWAAKQGAETFSLVVVSANTAACGLYRRLGMIDVGSYHYRIKE
ncbi:MAG: GNAT family N-acetyltransferase [Rhodobacteraceae bacterium]|nr:GNAT family N-acetyltransferase [Paracoccaceae bacterium]